MTPLAFGPDQQSEKDGEPAFPLSPIGPGWLLQAKVIAPAPPDHYLCRASLQAALDGVLERRITVLQAPAGFGKSTVLADICRTRKQEGVAVAWLSVDEDDTADVLGHYLARALQRAGVDLAALCDEDVWSSSCSSEQLGLLARLIETQASPCLLVLDEVERLPQDTVELLDRFVRYGSPNLHFALAFRTNPGLDLLPSIMEGTALVIESEQFRFSALEIARLIGGSHPRREMQAIEERTAGWPVAVMIERNTCANQARQTGVEGGSPSASLVGVRLLRGISAEDRARLLDLSVFDWVGADVVDEVLGSSDTRTRVSSLSCLDGLLLPIDEDREVLRLHPLVKEYCLGQLALEDPARKRVLHAEIAVALASRGQLQSAWRHATSAGDSRLLAELIEQFGAFGLWLRDGATGLASASGFLTPEILAAYPRLALLRCVHLQASGDFAGAAALYETTAQDTQGFTRDREGGNADALTVDRVFADRVLAGGWQTTGDSALDTLLPNDAPATLLRKRDRWIVVARNLLRCIFHYQFAEFEKSRQHGTAARAHVASSERYGEILTNTYLGLGGMVQGRVAEAEETYRRTRRLARTHFPFDQRLVAAIDLLRIELDLERNRHRGIRQRTLQGLSELRGVWNEVFLASVGVRAELTFQQYEDNAVVQYLSRTLNVARGTRVPALGTYVALLMVFYLARMRRVEEAARFWNDNALPCDPSQLRAEDSRTWRLMEALWMARATLLTEQGDCEAAGELADSGWRVSSECGATRVAMRCLGLSMVAADRAGLEDRALSRLAELLRMTPRADYFRALANAPETSRALLRKMCATHSSAELRGLAQAALARIGESARAPEFSPRELDILGEVREGLRNKEIAAFLGITEEGVRYHLRNVYRKAGVSKRSDAVRYAEAKGLLN